MAIYALIFLGSGIGGIFRFLLFNMTYFFLGTGYPYGTMLVNIIGGFLMGICFELFFKNFMGYSSYLKSFIMLGFLGGFTTFSSFSLDVYEFIKEENFQKAISYIFMQVVISVAALMCGIKLVKLGA